MLVSYVCPSDLPLNLTAYPLADVRDKRFNTGVHVFIPVLFHHPVYICHASALRLRVISLEYREPHVTTTDDGRSDSVHVGECGQYARFCLYPLSAALGPDSQLSSKQPDRSHMNARKLLG